MSDGNGRHVAQSDFDRMTLEEVRARRELIEKKIELGLMERRQSLLETINLTGGGWGSFVDPRESFFDRGEDMGPVPVLSSPSDRKQGDNWPLFRDHLQHGRLRQQSRVCAQTNSYARGLLRNLTNYVVGRGFQYKAVSKEKVANLPDAAVDKLTNRVADVQNFIDAFKKATGWMWREREAYRRTTRDGDAFLRLWHDEDGTTHVRWVEPERIIDPPGVTREDGWSYGIQHLVEKESGVVVREDVETVVQYNVANPMNPAQGELVPAAQIVHFKNLDEDSNVKRGLPFFSYDVLDALRRASKLQRNMSISSAIQASIAEIQQFESATRQEIQALADGQTSLQIASPLTGQQSNLQGIEPGTIRRMPSGRTFVPPPFSQGIPSHLQVVQGDLRQASSAASAPEYMTGDASNANYACHDAATQLLTRRGWLTWDQLQYGDEAGTMSPETHRFEWQRIKAIHVHDYDGEMVRLKGVHNLDALVTPNHRMYIARQRSERSGGRAGKIARVGLHPFQFVRADALQPDSVLPLACNPKTGILVECMNLPGYWHAGRRSHVPGRTVSHVLAGQVQSLAIQCGNVSHVRKQMHNGVWPVAIRPARRLLKVSAQHISRVPYVGKVWCVSVDNGLIVTRRNGKSLIAGNSTSEAGAPFIKGGDTEQAYYADKFVHVMWSALMWAVECEKLDRDVLDIVDIQASGPSIVHRDGLQQAQENQIYVQLGCKDRQTVTGEIGGDWETVRANNLQYEEEHGQQGQGLGLGDLLKGDPADETKGLRESKDGSGHEHAADGKFGSGGGSASHADHADKFIAAEAKLSPAKKKLVGRCVDFAKKQYTELESTYGRKGAIAIMGATLVLFPVPGSSLVPVAAIAAAKAYKSFKGQPAKTDSVTEGGDDDRVKAVREFMAALCQQAGEEMPELTDAAIHKAVEMSNE